MRKAAPRLALSLCITMLCTAALAQGGPKLASTSEPKSVTVPITLSHDRVIIAVLVQLSDGTIQRVHAWVDNGNPDLYMSRELVAGPVSCDGRVCSAAPPVEMSIGDMTIPIGKQVPGAGIRGAEIKEAKIPAGGDLIAPGLDAEINIPSTILRNYDVLIDFPEHRFTIAQPGSLKFNGVQTKVLVNPQNGLIQIPSKIENKKYNLALDLGQSISLLSSELFDKLSTTHPGWPHMTGAIGPANISGANDEPDWKLMRLDRAQFGPLFLTNVAVAEFPKDRSSLFELRAGVPTAGLLGAEALLNYRVGIDYAHSTVYFDIGRLFNVPDFDVIGIILRPEDDGHFTILGVADYQGKPSVSEGPGGILPGDHLVAVDDISVLHSTLGQVWSMLGGSPGKEHALTIERAGKQFTVIAPVQRFLDEAQDASQESQPKKQAKKNN